MAGRRGWSEAEAGRAAARGVFPLGLLDVGGARAIQEVRGAQVKAIPSLSQLMASSAGVTAMLALREFTKAFPKFVSENSGRGEIAGPKRCASTHRRAEMSHARAKTGAACSLSDVRSRVLVLLRGSS